MSNYIENSLYKDEKIIKKATFSKVYLFLLIVACILFSLVVFVGPWIISYLTVKSVGGTELLSSEEINLLVKETVMEDFLGPDAIVPLVVLISLIAINIVKLLTNNLCYTNKRVMGKTGIFSIKTIDFSLANIDSVSVKTSFFGRIFNYSEISIIPQSGDAISISMVKSAQEFKKTLLNEIEEYKQAERTNQAGELKKAIKGNENI